jgi:hypothetical protein
MYDLFVSAKSAPTTLHLTIIIGSKCSFCVFELHGCPSWFHADIFLEVYVVVELTGFCEIVV